MKRNFNFAEAFVFIAILCSFLAFQTPNIIIAAPIETAKNASDSKVQPKEKSDSNSIGPRITFDALVHDLGDIGPETVNKFEFKFTNTGDQLLKVRKKVDSTCGCTVPKLKKTDYAPGESGTVDVTYTASNSPARIMKRLTIHSNDKEKPTVKLVIKARIVTYVTVEPKRLKLALNKENADLGSIVLKCIDDKPFAIKSFESDANAITLNFDPNKTATQFVLNPKVDKKILANDLRGSIVIGLSHPNCKNVRVNYETLAPYKTDPVIVLVKNAIPEEPIQQTLWLLSNYDEDFELVSAEPEKGLLKLISKEKVGNRYKMVLEVTPPPIKDNQRFFTDTWIMNIKDGTTVKVRVSGWYDYKLTNKRKSDAKK